MGVQAKSRFFSLVGKSPEEIKTALANQDRETLLELICWLACFEHLVTSGEIAKASRVRVREVLADMKAGRFSDPIFGRGFFIRGPNSFKVTRSAANRWRREWFVPRESIPNKKKGLAGENRVAEKNGEQKARAAIDDSWQSKSSERKGS